MKLNEFYKIFNSDKLDFICVTKNKETLFYDAPERFKPNGKLSNEIIKSAEILCEIDGLIQLNMECK